MPQISDAKPRLPRSEGTVSSREAIEGETAKRNREWYNLLFC